jgi:hypothetical protein
MLKYNVYAHGKNLALLALEAGCNIEQYSKQADLARIQKIDEFADMISYLADRVETNFLDQPTRSALYDAILLTVPDKSLVDSSLYICLRKVASSLKKRNPHDLSYLASFCYCLHRDMNTVANERDKEKETFVRNLNRKITDHVKGKNKLRREIRKRSRLN